MAFQLNEDISIVKSVVDSVGASIDDLDMKYKDKISTLEFKAIDTTKKLAESEKNVN